VAVNGLISLEQQRRLKLAASFVIVLNMLDGVLTLLWTGLGAASEINPLMNLLLTIDPLLFMITKLLLVSLGVSLLWHYRANAFAAFSLYLCCTVYCSIILYHLGGGLVVVS
jgi:hypothetical protein